jgi:hypothetical protein
VITVEEIMRFNRLRHRAFRGIRDALAEDGHCKSYEGAFSIHMPNYFTELSPPSTPAWGIELHCYVIGPNRQYEWVAPTFAEALAAAEADVGRWLADEDYFNEKDFEEACIKAEAKALQDRLVAIDTLLGAPRGPQAAGGGA